MSKLIDILRKSRVTRFFLVPLLSTQLAVFPLIHMPKAEADTKRQTIVSVEDTNYSIDNNNIVQDLNRIPIENESIVRKALVTKRVLDTLKVDDLDRLYKQFKTEKVLVDVFKNLSWILTLEAKLLKYVLAIGDYPTLSTLTIGDILATARQIANNPKRNLLHLISDTYEEIDSRMNRLRRIRSSAINNDTLTHDMATEALSHKGFRRIYQQPTFSFFRRIQNQEFLVGEWTSEFYQPLLEIAKRTNTDELLNLAFRRLKQFLSRYDAYKRFIIEFEKSREESRLERKEFDEAIEKLVRQHFTYITPQGMFHTIYRLRCVENTDFKTIFYTIFHQRAIDEMVSREIKRHKKEGLSESEVRARFFRDVEEHDSKFREESKEICIREPNIRVNRIHRQGDYALIHLDQNVLKQEEIIGVLKRERGKWKIYDGYESGGIEGYWNEWTQRIRILTAQ